MDELTALKERIYDTVETLPTDPERQRVEAELRTVHRADNRVVGPYSDLIDLVRLDARFVLWPELEKPESPVIKINNEYQYIFYFAEVKDRKNFNKTVDVYRASRLRNLTNAINLAAKNRAARQAVSNSANLEISSPSNFTYNSEKVQPNALSAVYNENSHSFSPKKGGRRTRTKKRKGDRTKRRLK